MAAAPARTLLTCHRPYPHMHHILLQAPTFLRLPHPPTANTELRNSPKSKKTLSMVLCSIPATRLASRPRRQTHHPQLRTYRFPSPHAHLHASRPPSYPTHNSLVPLPPRVHAPLPLLPSTPLPRRPTSPPPSGEHTPYSHPDPPSPHDDSASITSEEPAHNLHYATPQLCLSLSPPLSVSGPLLSDPCTSLLKSHATNRSKIPYTTPLAEQLCLYVPVT